MPNRLLLAAARKPGLKKLITGTPITKAVARRFVAGETLEEAVQAARNLNTGGLGAILDYLGENCSTGEQADAGQDAYIASLETIVSGHLDSHVSVKLTQLGLDQSFDGCLARMEKIVARAAEARTTVAIDMESHQYTDATIEMYRKLLGTHSNVVLCLQAYLKRTARDIEGLLPLAPKIRLCKGAYDEPNEISFDRHETSRNYIELLEMLLLGSEYTAVATHDDLLVRAAVKTARRLSLPLERIEFQMLFGVRRELQIGLAERGYAVRVYVPFGDQWYPYLMRRLAERPANMRFFAEALIRG
ncbi:MAG TPA: proline dehydrogenase family protein [Actinomycetota bacterium]|nr:proline dehydrogenase family protein [Actinomycetota bacterium]